MMLKVSGVVLAALAASLVAANAADLPQAPPPPSAPAMPTQAFGSLGGNFTGLYMGLDGAMGVGSNKGSGAAFDNVTGASLGSGYFKDSQSGGYGGIDVGYNFQAGMFVVGGETNFGFSNLGSSAYDSGMGGSQPWSMKMTETYQGDVVARAGVAYNSLFPYFVGGWAYDHMTVASNNYAPNNFSVGVDRSGWTIGAGLEMALSRNLFLRGEYRYTDYGDTDVTSFNASGTTTKYSVSGPENLFKVGLDWKVW